MAGTSDNPANKQELLAKAWAAADASGATLNERLAYYAEATRQIRPDLIAAYDRFVNDLQSVKAGSSAPQTGDEMPDFLLPNRLGRLIPMSSLLANGPLVVSFNRGHWCPYCRLELATLARAHPDIFTAGASTVSIIPEISEFTTRLYEMFDLPFEVLTDMDLDYTRTMGLAIAINDELKDYYLSGGIDLPWFHGTTDWLLPIPATLVVGQEGIIKARYVDPDFRRRMPMDDIIAGIERA